MTPEEFARRMREVVNGETEYDKGDNEIIHEVLDDIMCECLRSIGYGEGVDIFDNYEKWYA